MTWDFLTLWFFAVVAGGVILALVFLSQRPKPPRGFPIEASEPRK